MRIGVPSGLVPGKGVPYRLACRMVSWLFSTQVTDEPDADATPRQSSMIRRKPPAS
ncbi:MAG: hypothetical protein R2719_00445 [Micropruina sp.]